MFLVPGLSSVMPGLNPLTSMGSSMGPGGIPNAMFGPNVLYFS